MSPTAAVPVALLVIFGACALARAATNDDALPLPRFVSLRAEEAQMRTGPGQQYPIKWTYQRPGLPLEIIQEFHLWRRVRDWQGAEGWMHSRLLSGKRYVMVVNATCTMRAKASPASPALAQIEPKVIGKVVECPARSDWCLIEVKGLKGWLQRKDLWGVYPNEAIE